MTKKTETLFPDLDEENKKDEMKKTFTKFLSVVIAIFLIAWIVYGMGAWLVLAGVPAMSFWEGVGIVTLIRHIIHLIKKKSDND